ncbi:MAG: glycosyltransferase family 39 protein [Butyrivibrio sp.]|nr:glycosyltransferase family 39 protein [Butyrivibrio sp.]
MKKVVNAFNLIIAACLAIAAAAVLVISSLTTVYYEMHCDNDQPLYGRENYILLFISVVAVLVFFYLLYRFKLFNKSSIFVAAGITFVTVYCLMLILAIHPQAVNDSKTLDDVINSFMTGDYSSLTNPGGYLFVWPFQLGYVAFGMFMGSIFGPSNYFAWDIVQLVSILVTMLLIFLITREIFENESIAGMAALMSFGALFFYNYVTYIYGDILSMAPQTLALYMMIRFVKTDKIRYGVVSAISIAAAVVIKTNCEITLIALVMILIGSTWDYTYRNQDIETKANSKRFVKRLALAVVFLAITFGAKAGVDAYFCNLTGLEKIPDGNPAWAHIAMGLQESELEDGWYNGYNYHVFSGNGYDSARTADAAKENIAERLSYFASNPKAGIKFFSRKFATQWADPVCVSTHNLDLVSRHVENQSELCDFLVFGKGSRILAWIMNVFMTVCYLGVLVFLINAIRMKKLTTPRMLLLILIFGGMLFHEFWEGSSRYAMRYYIYWLPYAAAGMEVIFGYIHKHGKS